MDPSLFLKKDEITPEVENKMSGQNGVVKQMVKNTAFASTQKFMIKHQEMMKKIKNLTELPEPGYLVNILSDTQFNAFTFIPYVLSQKKIKTLSVATYSITPKVINSLIELYDNGIIEKLNLFISGHLLNVRPKTAKYLIDIYNRKDKNVTVGFTHSHAKITILDNYVISGSGNMNRNSRLEQYFLSNSKEMASFFLENFFNKFSVTDEDLAKV